MVRAMTTTPETLPHDLYTQANRLNAKLASVPDGNLVREARDVAKRLLEYVGSKVPDLEDFRRRVALSEQFSLTESRQVPKTERELKVLLLRAETLLETAGEAEVRASRGRPGGRG